MSENETEVTPTKEEEVIAGFIAKKRGNISAVAKSLKIARKTVYHKINKSEYLQTVLDDARETILDDAEDKLGGAVRKGEAWAVCFILKTKGKKRGYVEKQEINHSGEVAQYNMTQEEWKAKAEARIQEANETMQKFDE